MRDRFLSFLLVSRWASAILALLYHARFLLFVDYDDVHAKTGLARVFYFLTGLGHESFAVFFVVDGILAGRMLVRHRAGTASDRAAVWRHAGALYRILLPGLVLGIGFDVVGARFFNQTGLYTAYPEFSTLTLSLPALVGNAFMLQPFIVPTFGSNGMLYLLSFLFWSHVLLFMAIRTAPLDTPRRQLAQALIVAIVVVVMPPRFLVWAATWLAGVAVVVLGRTRRARPPLAAAIACCAAALVLSRLIGADTHLLPAPFGAWLIQCKYLLVGVSFGIIAWALYPRATWRHAGAGAGSADGQGREAASFTFFCHFPVIMLLVGTGSALLDQPLMQQPTPARYAEFAGLVAACLVTLALVVRAVALAMGRLRTRR